jgi:hypothetical protein
MAHFSIYILFLLYEIVKNKLNLFEGFLTQNIG